MDSSILMAAMAGYEFQLQAINEAMAEIRRQLGHRSSGSSTSPVAGAPHARRQMSAEAKKRIAAAQKKRWANFHAQQGEASAKAAPKKSAPKRKMSAERKAALVANLAKARAARAAKRAAA